MYGMDLMDEMEKCCSEKTNSMDGMDIVESESKLYERHGFIKAREALVYGMYGMDLMRNLKNLCFKNLLFL